MKSSRVPVGTGPLLFSSDVLGVGRRERGGATQTKTLPADCGIAGPAAAGGSTCSVVCRSLRVSLVFHAVADVLKALEEGVESVAAALTPRTHSTLSWDFSDVAWPAGGAANTRCSFLCYH